MTLITIQPANNATFIAFSYTQESKLVENLRKGEWAASVRSLAVSWIKCAATS